MHLIYVSFCVQFLSRFTSFPFHYHTFLKVYTWALFFYWAVLYSWLVFYYTTCLWLRKWNLKLTDHDLFTINWKFLPSSLKHCPSHIKVIWIHFASYFCHPLGDPLPLISCMVELCNHDATKLEWFQNCMYVH